MTDNITDPDNAKLVDSAQAPKQHSFIEVMKLGLDILSKRAFGVMGGEVNAAVRQTEATLKDELWERAKLLMGERAWEEVQRAYTMWDSGSQIPEVASYLYGRKLGQRERTLGNLGAGEGRNDGSGHLYTELRMQAAPFTNTVPGPRYEEEDTAESAHYIRTEAGTSSQYARMAPRLVEPFQRMRVAARSMGSGPVYSDRSLEVVAMVDATRAESEEDLRWPG